MYTSTVNNSFKFLGRVASLLPDTNCKRSATRFVIASLMLFTFITNFANSARADCLTDPPNQVISLGPNVHSSMVQSVNTSYSTSPCKAWIVDILVPSNSTGTGSDLKSFHMSCTSDLKGTVGPPDKAKCVYSEYMT